MSVRTALAGALGAGVCVRTCTNRRLPTEYHKRRDMQTKAWCVYVLVSTGGSTYVGSTVDKDRRLRQHNRELRGGARATGIKVAQGEVWTRAAHVTGFPDWRTTLQFEWRWKQLTRRVAKRTNPLANRFRALARLLTLERPTRNSLPYTRWSTQPEVHPETTDARRYTTLLLL